MIHTLEITPFKLDVLTLPLPFPLTLIHLGQYEHYLTFLTPQAPPNQQRRLLQKVP